MDPKRARGNKGFEARSSAPRTAGEGLKGICVNGSGVDQQPPRGSGERTNQEALSGAGGQANHRQGKIIASNNHDK